MVYTSIPAYIDPVNWHQQQPPNEQQQGNNTGLHHPQPANQQPNGAGGSAGSIRPGSMADRARMANIPMQEPAQKCPRCESTNTKFCYFNNYSLSQPRHFCKTCRRYWTRGGALRSVPVGGSRRRNKRTKGGSSKASTSSSKSSPATSTGGGPSNSASSNGTGSASDVEVRMPPPPPSLRFMSPLDHHFSGSGGEMGLNYGMNYGTISGDLNFHIASALGGASGGGARGSGVGLEQWRVPQTQQFPFLAGLEAPSHGLLYPFESSTNNEVAAGYGGGVRPASGVISQMASVKMKDSGIRELNLSRQFLGINNSNSTSDQLQYWSTDLSRGFSSSSTTTNQL